MQRYKWHSPANVGSKEFTCGYCTRLVAATMGYFAEPQAGRGQPLIRICPNCELPTFFNQDTQVPGVAPGNAVGHLPADIQALYKEARQCVAASAPTSAVLTCRKLLMNIAVEQQAEEGKSFLHYVDYLATKGYVPPNGRAWVDHIRQKGNEANHEIKLMSADDALELILFIEMLLKFIYEFPAKVPTVPKTP